MDMSERSDSRRLVWLSGLEQLMQNQPDDQCREPDASPASAESTDGFPSLEFSYQVLADREAAATRTFNASR